MKKIKCPVCGTEIEVHPFADEFGACQCGNEFSHVMEDGVGNDGFTITTWQNDPERLPELLIK